MMTGTPGRPGIAITGPLLSAHAAPAVPTKTASISAVRIASNPDRPVTLIEAVALRVKAGRQTHGKPNVQAFMLRQFAGVEGAKMLTGRRAAFVGDACGKTVAIADDP